MTQRVWTRIVSRWDDELQSYVRVEEESESFMYDGPVALCKGDDTAKQSEEASLENQQAQMNFNQQLMSVFQQQFGQQKDVLNYIKGKMQPMIDNPTGYSQDALNSMRTSTTDQISNQYQSAQQALNREQFANGSRDLPSGVNDQLDAALLQSEASDKAAAQNNITVQDANLKQANYWNAVNTLSGTAAQFNPEGMAAAATGAANSASSAGSTVSSLSQAYTASQGPSVGAILGGLAGGAISAAGNAGGFKNLFCWVAAAIYGGWDEPRTVLVREYLRDDFGQRWYGRPVVWLYSLIGEWVAKHRVLVKILTPLFNLALRKAQEKK